ncbi:MAG: hypothetical protein HYX34_02970 [Actinobacteria bacterium]|nr:hypothetical protein [Actinomycetota bacterium]
MVALLLVPLMIFAAFGVDVGSFYLRAAEIQRAADAAALAGVVWMPNIDQATVTARATALRNGFENGKNGITVEVKPVDANPNELDVIVTDTKVPFIFGKVVRSDLSIKRSARARLVLPVPLGSPEWRFGSDLKADGTPLDSSYTPNLWLNIFGWQSPRRNGDVYGAGCLALDCGSPDNSSYRAAGYRYVVDVPATGAGTVNLQVYDAGFDPRTSETDPKNPGDCHYAPTGGCPGSDAGSTIWSVYGVDDTPLDPKDNPLETCSGGNPLTIANGTTASPTAYINKWVSLCTFSDPGRHFLTVRTVGNWAGSNRYSLKATTSTSTKPRLYAYGDMSIYNNIGAGQSSFYLADVQPVQAGKVFRVQMFDPGDVSGDATMELIDPTGAVVTKCDATSNSPSSSFGSSATLTPCSFKTAVSGSSKFQDSWITLDVSLPSTYTCTVCWWKVRYTLTAQAADTTTWQARIVGDPVTLVS